MECIVYQDIHIAYTGGVTEQESNELVPAPPKKPTGLFGWLTSFYDRYFTVAGAIKLIVLGLIIRGFMWFSSLGNTTSSESLSLFFG